MDRRDRKRLHDAVLFIFDGGDVFARLLDPAAQVDLPGRDPTKQSHYRWESAADWTRAAVNNCLVAISRELESRIDGKLEGAAERVLFVPGDPRHLPEFVWTRSWSGGDGEGGGRRGDPLEKRIRRSGGSGWVMLRSEIEEAVTLFDVSKRCVVPRAYRVTLRRTDGVTGDAAAAA